MHIVGKLLMSKQRICKNIFERGWFFEASKEKAGYVLILRGKYRVHTVFDYAGRFSSGQGSYGTWKNFSIMFH